MIKEIYDEAGVTLIRTEEATPVCGEDFCDSCGDCLDCQSEDECPSGRHSWVQYGEVTPNAELSDVLGAVRPGKD